jgi:hypothetical protein
VLDPSQLSFLGLGGTINRTKHHPETLTVSAGLMTGYNLRVCSVLFSLSVIFSSLAGAEKIKIEGFIVGNNDDQIIVKFGSGPGLTFLLTEDTEVSTMDGVPKEHRSSMYATLLIPGLKVQVEGTYNQQRQVIATRVKFKKDDQEQAQAAQAATQETKTQAEANKEHLEQHNEELEMQNEALQKQQAQSRRAELYGSGCSDKEPIHSLQMLHKSRQDAHTTDATDSGSPAVQYYGY